MSAVGLADAGSGLRAVVFGDDPDDVRAQLQAMFPGEHLIAGSLAPTPVVRAYLRDPRAHAAAASALALDLRGTPFQQRVWHALRAMPLGTTCSYADLAAAIGAPTSVRAVASACARNRVAALVPCHRVLRQDGTLGGYRWGLARKAALLEAERGDRS